MIDRKAYMSAYNKAYYQRNKEREKQRTKEYVLKNLDQVKEARKKWYREQGLQYRQAHLDKMRMAARKYWLTHPRPKIDPEKSKVVNAKYRANHKSEITKRNVEYAKRRKKACPEFKIRQLLRNRILSALKMQCADKAYKSIDLLGCSIKDYRDHLERQFTEGMTWANHGLEWEIDHIIPIATFNLLLPEEQKKAFHFTNTQPLNLKANRQKQPKRLDRTIV